MLQNVQSLFFDKTESIKSDELQNFKSFDTEKVDITLRQLERDWSSSGKTERNQCYKPILDELDLIYDPSNM